MTSVLISLFVYPTRAIFLVKIVAGTEQHTLITMHSFIKSAFAVTFHLRVIIVKLQSCLFQATSHISTQVFWYYCCCKLIKGNRTLKLRFKIHCWPFFANGFYHIIKLLNIFIRKFYTIFLFGILFRFFLNCCFLQAIVSNIHS